MNTEAIEALQKIADNKHRIVHAVVHRSYGYNTDASWYKDQIEKERIEIEKLNKEAAEIELIIKQLKNNDDNILSHAISHYGEPAQFLKAIEETLELAIELIAEIKTDEYEDAFKIHDAACFAVDALDCVKLCDFSKVTYDKTNADIKSIVTEIADVEIMLRQLKIIHDCDEEVEKAKQAKLSRLVERMAGDSQ